MYRNGFDVRLAGSLLVFAVVLALVGGCGGPPKKKMGKVAGTVNYDGKPVTDGQVHFISNTGYGTVANITDSGKYATDPIEAAEYKVYVAPHPPGQQAPGTAAPKQATSVIPAKYRDPESSGLTFTVVEGKDNTFNIELK
jgi:hypothetical protein